MARDVAMRRLGNQRVAAPSVATPGEVVGALGAMQAQDYAGALWSIGLRVPGATVGDVERAVSERAIARTWALRGTLHFVAGADLRWMIALTGPRTITRAARRHAELALDAKTLARCEKVVAKALRGGRQLTRSAAMALLEANGVATAAQRGYHVLAWLALTGVVCFGPREGKEAAFVLVDEWLPLAPPMERDEALTTLATRYFTSHGPATANDFARWSGLAAADARAALEGAKAGLVEERIGDVACWAPTGARAKAPPAARGAYLLPGFDEYMLGYTDRSAALAAAHADTIVPGGNGMFRSTIVVAGKVVGTWRCAPARKSARITLEPFAPLAPAARKAIARAAEDYGRFLGRPDLDLAP